MIRVIVICVIVLVMKCLHSCVVAGKRADAAMQSLFEMKINTDNQNRRQ